MEPNEYESDFHRSGSKHHEPDQKLQQILAFVATNTTDESRKIRQTFIRLAEIFHSERVASREMENSYTESVNKINKAYQKKDLTRLLEIERQHLQGELNESNS